VHTSPAFPPERKPLAILCILAVLALLWATLSPFNPYPRNGVAWLPDDNGIRFEHSAVILSEEPLLPPAGQATGEACAIEIYLRPADRNDSDQFLTFSSDDNPDAVFLRQWRESLLINKSRPIHTHGTKLLEFDVEGVLRIGQLVLLTISSGSHGTTVYADGKVAGNDPHFRILPDELYRQIVMGNSPTSFQVWHGEIRGLAIYDAEVSPAEAARHYAEWSSASSSPAATATDVNHLLARYNFSERSGNTIRSEVASAPPLLIPAHFFIPRKRRLDSVINQFEWTERYRFDVFENIVGFMPLGFVLCGFFALSRPRGQAILISTLCGGFLSFSIEFLQYYIPRRDSGWTDVVTNTTGTLLGALVAFPLLVCGALRLVNLIPPRRNNDASRT
jgi:VanZ family protein